MKRPVSWWLRAAILSGAAMAVASAYAACALDENGLVGDASVVDVTQPDNFVGDAGPDVVADNSQPTCTDPDASFDASCLGNVALDGSWKPIAVVLDASAVCPGTSADFVSGDWLAGIGLASGACRCSTPTPSSANWTCGGSVTLYANAGNNCTGAGSSSETFAAAVHCSQLQVNGNNQSVQANAPTAQGITCSTSPAPFAVTGTAVRTCLPSQCTSDFCGLKNAGYNLCLVYNGFNATCPSGFKTLPGIPQGLIDVDADIQGGCNTCVSTPKAASCTASISVFAGAGMNACSDAGGYLGNYAADGNCHGVNSNFGSELYLPDPPPAAACNAPNPNGGPSPGSPAFGSKVKTICCQ